MSQASPSQGPSAQNELANAELAALLDYLDTVAIALPAPVTEPGDLQPLADPVPVQTLTAELAALPDDQLLHTFRQWKVYFASQAQAPAILHEITRLRELTFREMQEGSGLAVDTDEFDATYDHLFVWDEEAQTIVGGYRLGHADVLRAAGGPDAVYLSAMFDFDDAFFSEPTLEIGRSFVVPEFQRKPYSLHLLWCGIGNYMCRYPHYRRIYGVVSISRLYDVRTSAAIRDALVQPLETVAARAAFTPDLGDPWREFLKAHTTMSLREVSSIVKGLEGEGKDVPVLIRHYHKLGARFVSAAVDASFNNTPGLLLCLDVPRVPYKYLKQYFGEDGAAAYLAFSADEA